MTYGITGNPQKERLWDPSAELVSHLQQRGYAFCIETEIAEGLLERGLIDDEVCAKRKTDRLSEEADLVFSFGGDGTMLRTAHMLGRAGTPVLGVNIGRLGFLADIEVNALQVALDQLEAGDYRIESRNVLHATFSTDSDAGDESVLDDQWALNEFVLDRSGMSGLIHIDVSVNGIHMNRYWADGLIIATPTGSTAYSLSAGGPILVPGADATVLTPIAPHTLTVRPVVLPGSAVIRARVLEDGEPYVLAADGTSHHVEKGGFSIEIKKASHTVNLVKLQGQEYFQTLRSKLKWGA